MDEKNEKIDAEAEEKVSAEPDNDEEKSEKSEEKPKLTKYEQQQEAKKKLKNDKDYKRARKIYDGSMLALCILLLLNAIRYFLRIEVIINGMVCTQFYYLLYLIPCVCMIISLVKSKKAAEKYHVAGGEKVGIIAISVATALVAGLGMLNIVQPSYHVYETETLSLREGQELTIVRYVNLPAFKQPKDRLPGDYSLDVYKTAGIFARRIATTDVTFGTCTVELGKGDNGYLLNVQTRAKTETIPFYY